ncbi:MAG: hypothetical protein ACI8S6_005891, partial [Myxococcota bacterium]
KRAVPGAPSLLRGLSRDEQARIFILSGSPTQMRDVLEEKLRLDGVRFESLILKDNLGNLRRGRFRAIRGQFGYKLPSLLASRLDITADVRETLFGDDAEVDALIYSVYADIMAGRLTPAQVSRILEAAGAYPDRIELALGALSELSIGEDDVVEDVFIHLERSSPPHRFAALGHRVVPVFSWWQAALVLHERGRLDGESLASVMEEIIEAETLSVWGLSGLAQDLVRRGHASPGVLDEVPGDAAAHCRKVLVRIPDQRPPTPVPPGELDYIGMLQRWDKA